jgi:hypothetical protein
MPDSYSGDPTNYPGAVDIPTGSDPPGPGPFQAAFKGTIDRTAFLARLELTARFYGTQVGPAGLASNACACWDPVALKWLVAGVDSTPNLRLVEGRGHASGWNFLGPGEPSLRASSVCRGSGTFAKNVYVGSWSNTSISGLPFVVALDTTGPTWGTGVQVIAGASDATSVVVLAIGNNLVAALGSSTTIAHSNIFYSADGGATWTAQGATTPAVLVPSWVMAQTSPGVGPILAFVQLPGAPGFLSTADGSTWVENPITLPATGVPTALVYGSDGSGIACWILTVVDNVSFTTTFYRSYDGVTFTSFPSSLPPLLPLLSMAAIGSLCVATIATDTGQARILYSEDGCQTWQVSDGIIPSSSNAIVVGGPNAFLGLSTTNLTPSFSYGSPGGIGTL